MSLRKAGKVDRDVFLLLFVLLPSHLTHSWLLTLFTLINPHIINYDLIKNYENIDLISLPHQNQVTLHDDP